VNDELFNRLAEAIAADLAEVLVEPLAEAIAERLVGSPYLTADETASFLRTSRARVDNLASAGELVRFKEGGRVLFLRSQVAARVRAENGRRAASVRPRETT